MDLQKIMNDKLQELNDNKFVENTISEAISKTVVKISNDVFGEYSEFGKKLKEHLKTNLDIAFDNVNLTGYNAIVGDIVTAHIHGTIAEGAEVKIKDTIKSVIGAYEQREWKLSEIVQKFIDCHGGSGYDEEPKEMSLHIITSSWNTTYISIDEKNDKRRWECAYQLTVDKDGRMWNYEVKGVKPDILSKCIIGSFDTLLFNIHTSGSKVIIDRAECEGLVYEIQYSDF